ncbi:MAG: prepilin-type N-terminal cleavage/methylation domain-containing protein [Candidatus Marinimicrobia bacterium]|nr:prepilin-type N-terminal cleavage/methylation domain-containing protein [Candidatus Neomarinimicrobiota bacterium]
MTTAKNGKKRSQHTVGALFFWEIKSRTGFSLVELIVTVAIIGMLAVVAVPIFTELSANAKIAKSEADLESIRTAFVNHYYNSMLFGQPGFPEPPADGLMTSTWADTTTLFDGGAPASLFSEGKIPTNPMGNSYEYSFLDDAGGRVGGFILKDPDIKNFVKFQP